MRAMTFASRNIKELLRDPLSYLFCLGFPLLMLVVMTVVNSSIPEPNFPEGVPIPEGTAMSPTVFQIQKLTPAIAVFGLSFLSLFCCLRVSSDRSSTFLMRLYASPMKGIDYILGYFFPFAGIALAQIILTYIAGDIIAVVTGKDAFNVGYMLLSLVLFLPSMLIFIGLGILMGVLFNEKAAPGVCSAIITAASLLGGIWMDIEQMGGVLLSICDKLPFYHSVQAARFALVGNFGEIGIPLAVCSAYAVVIFALSVFAFMKKMQSDKR
ncbi:MAG TPA: ABC transporter permease [Ruminococcaceae bacterium]|nr:ABC transporter permease [Oscillospiraceae bacterium]